VIDHMWLGYTNASTGRFDTILIIVVLLIIVAVFIVGRVNRRKR
jgi:hypothetical protein